ncbi:MAG: 4Fe-4S binding protein [candidate division NC10 bacterium]|nr:4Fe-4S binding protein [candidate division NC10 bacterium]
MEQESIRRYANEQVSIEIREDWCKGCSICVEFCPKRVLAMNRRGKPEVIDLEACSQCGWCDLRCPDFAITVKQGGEGRKRVASGERRRERANGE